MRRHNLGTLELHLVISMKRTPINIRGHIAAQDLESEENGGLLNPDQFESGSPDFTDRFRIDVRYTDANNRILGKRYYLDHQLKLLNVKRDSTRGIPTSLTLGHEYTYETKLYDFTQTSQNSAFGEDPFTVPIDDRARLKTTFNKLSAEFANRILGRLTGTVSHYYYNYFFNSIVETDEGIIQKQIIRRGDCRGRKLF